MKKAMLALLLTLTCACRLSDRQPEMIPLFNGTDLSGWINVNCGPDTWSVRDGMIVCSGIPTGVLRTDRQYENFILELEWRHMKPNGNAGLFVHSDALPVRGQPFTRSIEVQVMLGDHPEGIWTGHGDIFAIQGATMTPDRPHPRGWMRCLPSEKRAKGAGEWNHYRVECRDGRISLAVNGKVVSGGSACNPRKGYICLESEGSEVHFRNLRIAELPSSSPPPEEVARADEGFTALYNGVDLEGWKSEPGHQGHWSPRNWQLHYDGGSQAEDKNLWTAREYDDFEMIVDWRLRGKPRSRTVPVVLPTGEQPGETVQISDYGDSGIYLRGNSKSQVNIWCWPIGSGEVYGYRTDAEQPAEVRAAVTPRQKADRPPGDWNRFRIKMKGERLTVALNGTTVIENAWLPEVPARGPIALQHHGDAIQFANLYIREIK